ncbi:19768_t:CDS:2 [Cetraspora pellucida]|uniref:19768_t:CDS:1 n=1 Tax=Cetraspora pellucida TaxID=1433469 RepID=A0A9N8WIQ0_9GLOM|nr:19768_t:CDS:2 [Cetraspora pellucida]
MLSDLVEQGELYVCLKWGSSMDVGELYVCLKWGSSTDVALKRVEDEIPETADYGSNEQHQTSQTSWKIIRLNKVVLKLNILVCGENWYGKY